jgi:sensor domain CHASE-containing protein
VEQHDSAKHFGGDLRRLTSLIGVAIAFFGVLLLAIIVYAGWAANETATDRERTLVANALNESIARALNEQKSIAWWDDPIIKITDQAIDLEFTDANFGVFLTETYGHDEVYVLNAEDKPLYAWSDAERKKPLDFEIRRSALEALIAEIRHDDRSTLNPRPDMFAESKDRYSVLTGVQVARWAGHIVSVDGRPAVVAGMTIVPNIDISILKGTLYRRGIHLRHRALPAPSRPGAWTEADRGWEPRLRALHQRRWRPGRVLELDNTSARAMCC